MLSKVFSVFVSGIAHVRSVLLNKMPGTTTLLVSEGFFDFWTVFSQLDINKFQFCNFGKFSFLSWYLLDLLQVHRLPAAGQVGKGCHFPL